MKLSVPSYVVPGTWLENLRWLLENTDQRRVELLFFLYDDETKAMLSGELAGILALADQFAYTVHLPDALNPESAELVQAFSAVADGFVVHPPRDQGGLTPFRALLDSWRDRWGADRFFLENTTQPAFLAADSITYRHGPLPLCVDLGHLVMEGIDPLSFIEPKKPRIRELHLHGVNAGKDHGPLSGEEAWLIGLSGFLSAFTGIVELEMFAWDQLKPALELLSRLTPAQAQAPGAGGKA